MSYLSGATSIEVIDCAECGMQFGMTDQFIGRRRDDGKTFYCPSGHSNYFGDTLAKKLKREREHTAQLTARLDQERSESAAQARRAAAARGQVTKIKKRIGSGICPCCNRSFEALAEHMKTEHPEFAESDAE